MWNLKLLASLIPGIFVLVSYSANAETSTIQLKQQSPEYFFTNKKGIPVADADDTDFLNIDIEQIIERALQLQREDQHSLPQTGQQQLRQSYDINQLFERGNQAQRAGKYVQAEVIWRRVIKVEPNNPAAYYNLGIALNSQNKLDEAAAAYRQSLRINPSDAVALNNLGNLLLNQGKLNEAIEILQEALIVPEQPEKTPASSHTLANANLGDAFWRRGNLDEANAACRRAIQMNPNYATAHHCLGNVLQDQNKLDEAISAYRRAIQLDQRFASAINGWGNVLFSQRKVDEAIAKYREATRADPNYAAPYINLGNAFSRLKKLDEAIAAYRKALKLPDDRLAKPTTTHTSAHNGLGLVFQQQRKLEEAIAEFKQAIKIDPNYVFSPINLKEAERQLALRKIRKQ